MMAALVFAPVMASAADVGPALDVAPGVEKTRLQHWPRAAWAEQSKCWLVVWREGDLNEKETDIWCARVSADGKAIDPEGIRVTGASGVQDRPVVASNGKDFLVAWQDMRSGNDWDVYAARVSGEGKVLDPNGFPLDDRPHNQCLPSLAFAGNDYYAAWQAWVEDAIVQGYGSYELRGARVSPDGKLLDPDGIALAKATALQPALAAHSEGGLVLAAVGDPDPRPKLIPRPSFRHCPTFLRIDPAKGLPLTPPTHLPPKRSSTDRTQVPGAVVLKDGSCLVTLNAWEEGIALLRVGPDGRQVGEWQKFGERWSGVAVPLSSLAGSGDRLLLTADSPVEPKKPGSGPRRMTVLGWTLAPDGSVLEGGKPGFAIAGSAALDAMQGVACTGPDGSFLVVCAEARGVENTKVVARVVR